MDENVEQVVTAISTLAEGMLRAAATIALLALSVAVAALSLVLDRPAATGLGIIVGAAGVAAIYLPRFLDLPLLRTWLVYAAVAVVEAVALLVVVTAW